MTAPKAFENVAKAIQDNLIGTDSNSPGKLIQAIHDVLGAPGIEGKGGPCAEIATAIIWPIVAMELTFVGIRIAFRQTFVDQFAQFTRFLIIAYIIIVAQTPQKLIRETMPKLTEGGKKIGKELIEKSGKTVQSDNPILYWGEWLGDIKKDKQDCKYHQKFIFKMYNEKAIPQLTEGKKDPLLERYEKFLDPGDPDSTGEPDSSLDKLYILFKEILPGSDKEDERSVFTYLRGGAMTTEDFIALLMPFMVLSMIVTAAMAQMAGYIAPVFTQVAVLVGSQCLLEFVLAVGLVVMPLMFFKTFNDIWAKHLTFCTGLMLIPCFYYILSGFGFVFSTLAFDAIFPEVATPQGSGPGLAVYLKVLFKTAIHDILPQFFKVLGNAFASKGLVLFFWVVAIFEKLFFYVGGTVIITTFVGGGVGFGAIAHGFAGAWDKAFSNQTLMDKINEFFQMVQGAVGSAVGQATGQAMSSTTNLIGGGARGIGKAMGGG
ncbi:MAG: hypothetical protein ACOY3I_01410 [Verrucomicrobiota bacterium]